MSRQPAATTKATGLASYRDEVQRYNTAVNFWTDFLDELHQTWDGKDAEEKSFLETNGKVFKPKESSCTLPAAIYKPSGPPALELSESEVRLLLILTTLCTCNTSNLRVPYLGHVCY